MFEASRCCLTGQRLVETVGLYVCRSSSIQKSIISCLGDFTSGSLANCRNRMKVSMIEATYLKDTHQNQWSTLKEGHQLWSFAEEPTRSYKLNQSPEEPDLHHQAPVLTTREPSAGKVFHRRRWLSCVHSQGCLPRGRSRHPSSPSSSPNCPSAPAKCSESPLKRHMADIFRCLHVWVGPLKQQEMNDCWWSDNILGRFLCVKNVFTLAIIASIL